MFNIISKGRKRLRSLFFIERICESYHNKRFCYMMKKYKGKHDTINKIKVEVAGIDIL